MRKNGERKANDKGEKGKGVFELGWEGCLLMLRGMDAPAQIKHP